MNLLNGLRSACKHKSVFSHKTFSFPIFRHMYLGRISDAIKVYIIPALQDNYMYLFIDMKSKIAAAVDPVEPYKIIETAEKEGAKLTTVLTTHHHYDHAGGNEIISKEIKNLSLYGGDDRIPCLTQKVTHNDTLQVGNLKVTCLLTPCHTNSHICYYIPVDKENPICFTGDTLFVAGCGRFFEGTASDMLEALNKLSSLPKNAEIYCGHEYTLSNLKFAVHVEPANKASSEKLKSCIKNRNNKQPTVPSTIGDELLFNPFMRVLEKDVQLYTKKTDVMAVLRNSKDNFKAE